jgi:hypothetical protein
MKTLTWHFSGDSSCFICDDSLSIAADIPARQRACSTESWMFFGWNMNLLKMDERPALLVFTREVFLPV